MGNELYIYKLNTQEIVVSFFVDTNNTESKIDDSKKIVFTTPQTTITTKNFRARDFDFLIALLIEEKVIDLQGNIDLNNLRRFKEKYNENNVYQMTR
jgi:hypothetical protein